MDHPVPPELASENELLREIGRGDRHSFELFYDRVGGVLFSVIIRILRNQQLSEDVLQEVFLEIWKKAPLYDEKRGKATTWVVVLARNRAIDRLRSIQREIKGQDELERETEQAQTFDSHDGFGIVADAESRTRVRDALAGLSSDQREVIEMAFFQSLTHTEIAERLDLPLGTVKARIRRGMLRLREIISQQNQAEEPHPSAE